MYSVYLRSDNCTMRDYVSRVLMMVCDVSEREAREIIMALNRDRWTNRALVYSAEEVLARHVYAGIRSAGLSAVITPTAEEADDATQSVPLEKEEEEEDDDDECPQYLDGTCIDSRDLPRYYQ